MLQKYFLGYVGIFAVLLCLIPVIQLQELDEVAHRSVWFFGSGMLWLQILVVVIIAKLVMLNSSPKWTKKVYQLIGRNNNEHMDNIVLLLLLLIMFLSTTESIHLFRNNISTVIKPTRFLLLLELYLLAGILRQAAITRLSWKKSGKAKAHPTHHVAHDVDTSKKEHAFTTVDKSVEGLFGKE